MHLGCVASLNVMEGYIFERWSTIVDVVEEDIRILICICELERAWRDTTGWEKPRDLDHFLDFLENFSRSTTGNPHLAWAPVAKGAPHTLIITGAALRAAHLSR